MTTLTHASYSYNKTPNNNLSQSEDLNFEKPEFNRSNNMSRS